jgi:predicted DNA binding CopG/RHH family protein
MSERKPTKYDPPFHDDEERDIISAMHKGEYRQVHDLDASKTSLKQAAKNTLRKKPITIRVQEQDIEMIKTMALEQGIPYQTLVSALLHQFAQRRIKLVA